MKITVNASTKIGYIMPKEVALDIGGKFAGICYMPDDFNTILTEDQSKTQKRVNQTLKSLHHSVYGHPHYCLYLEKIPKILAMILNNEKCYSTSEKSGRYTKMTPSPQEEPFYEKWLSILKNEISIKYPDFDESTVTKKAQENARYMISVFTPATDMEYTVSFSQLNYIIHWCEMFIQEAEPSVFNNQLIPVIQDFLYEVNHIEVSYKQNILDYLFDVEAVIKTIFELQRSKLDSQDEKSEFDLRISFVNDSIDEYRSLINEQEDDITILSLKVDALNDEAKGRRFSLFDHRNNRQEEFGENYCTTYYGSFTQLAQAQRHRTLSYHLRLLDQLKFYVPRIIKDNQDLVDMWLEDITSLAQFYPQGMLISIREQGTCENFILKCTERLCSNAQLETSIQTKRTLEKYIEKTLNNNSEVFSELVRHDFSCRLMFGYPCSKPCMWGDNQLSRLI